MSEVEETMPHRKAGGRRSGRGRKTVPEKCSSLHVSPLLLINPVTRYHEQEIEIPDEMIDVAPRTEIARVGMTVGVDSSACEKEKLC